MNSMFAESNSQASEIRRMRSKKTPSYREAYSDRTAWLMACMSELAYLKFNPLILNNNKRLIQQIEDHIDENRKKSLVKLIKLVNYDHEKEKEKINQELDFLSLNLYKTFDKNGTQAILVKDEKYIILAFRGTEADSIKDIKSDVKANLVPCSSGGRIHSGFKEAYEQVALNIEDTLNEEELKEKPLLITGHSLGGALATIAAKKITHQGGNAACYTFGSPRVGDENWISSMKTPVYRVVNAADCVTMLPPGDEIIAVLSWILIIIPYGKDIQSWLLSKFGGYLHGGNMRYMTNCQQGDYGNVKLLYSVSLFRRIKALIIKKLSWKKFLTDHSITVYRKKLMIIAHKRNP